MTETWNKIGSRFYFYRIFLALGNTEIRILELYDLILTAGCIFSNRKVNSIVNADIPLILISNMKREINHTKDFRNYFLSARSSSLSLALALSVACGS